MLPTKQQFVLGRVSKVVLLAGTLLIIILLSASGIPSRATVYDAKESSLETESPTEERVENKTEKEIVIQSGDTFATVMESSGISYEESQSILSASRDVYDFAKIQAGKMMHIVYVENALAAVDYDMNDDAKIVVEKSENGFQARKEAVVYDVRENKTNVTITNSLFSEGLGAGIPDKTLVELSDIFAWDIDFSTDIQEGDSFGVLYERRFQGEEESSPGNILVAQFINQGSTYNAYRFEKSDGTGGYYNEDGRSLARQFLKSPINFGYVSSGFSYRRVNPVTKQVTPHRAIDYAAPQGTPIIATAHGEVVVAGSKGDLGITVEIQHGEYRTQYAHLSKIGVGVKKGADIKQGDVVGYVGSTGISTGPHLQYALFKNGTPINPMSEDLPLGESLTGSELDAFFLVRGSLKEKLNN